jgi:hypothetical protein
VAAADLRYQTRPIAVSSERAATRLRTVTYVAASVTMLFAVALGASSPLAGLLPLALILGWCEVDGHCGTSHVCALTPLRVIGSGSALWVEAVGAYTLGGLATGGAIGALFGLARVAVGPHRSAVSLACALLALVLAARELTGWPRRLPQVSRQTHKMWAMEFGYVTGAAMWGSHIGLGVATVIRHGGIFALLIMCIRLGPAAGALLMSTFWLGRTLPVWVAPLLTADCARPRLLDREIKGGEQALRMVAAAALVGVAVIAVVMTSR